jgi:hypothetical protein
MTASFFSFFLFYSSLSITNTPEYDHDIPFSYTPTMIASSMPVALQHRNQKGDDWLWVDGSGDIARLSPRVSRLPTWKKLHNHLGYGHLVFSLAIAIIHPLLRIEILSSSLIRRQLRFLAGLTQPEF